MNAFGIFANLLLILAFLPLVVKAENPAQNIRNFNEILQQKALTFGQTPEELDHVRQILQTIKNVQMAPQTMIQPNTSVDLLFQEDEPLVTERRKLPFSKKFPEESDHNFEGDIILWPEQAENMLSKIMQKKSARVKRKFVASRYRKWDPKIPIPYTFDGTHSSTDRQKIKDAIKYWADNTCLRFIKIPSNEDVLSKNALVFTTSDGCASNVGKNPLEEPQYISLSSECMKKGVMAHEIAHALGFWHEQSRPDRDSYVTVRWRDVEKGLEGQFTKELAEDVDDGGIAYDYGSIMHYRSKAYSRNEHVDTITTNIAGYQRTIGQRAAFAFGDVKLMNLMYCNAVCKQKLPCLRDGYTDPKNCNKCRCPDGFGGKICDQIAKGDGETCGGMITVTATDQHIHTPGYPENTRAGVQCSWLLKAPAGSHVELTFDGPQNIDCPDPGSFCVDYVEIQNSTSYDTTGMRFCCNDIPNEPIYSAGNEMLVLYRSIDSRNRFRARVRYVQSEGNWFPWGPWGPCTAPCGGCGTQVRYRGCHRPVCRGEFVQSRSCNPQPCIRCLDSFISPNPPRRSSIVPAPCVNGPQCCEGYSLEGNDCVIVGGGRISDNN